MKPVRTSNANGSASNTRLEFVAPRPSCGLEFLGEFERGWVCLTGAGPGDPGLLTLQAFQALQDADIVFYDALVSEEVLALIPTKTVKVFVGKRAGHQSLSQPEITRKLIKSARSGLRVLRLKGGDPFVFGRGAEEAIELGAAGVPFRILPGVTAGIGGLAYAGLAVTHRDYNQAVTLITAHDASGGLSSALDWAALVRGSPVLVIYMGFRLLDQIADRLVREGRAINEPVAVVSKATTAQQQTIVTTLGAAADDVAKAGLESPAMIVVGEIVCLKEALDWSERLMTTFSQNEPIAAGTGL